MQVLLIQPPIEDFYSTDCRTLPAGLLYIASAIKKKFPEIEIIIYDALSTGKKRTISFPPEFNYLKKYYGFKDNSPYRLFQHYYRFGKTSQEIYNDLKNLNPFFIGISSMFSPYYKQSIEVAELCKNLFPLAKIVFGGSHATAAPDSLLFAHKSGVYFADFVIPGEAEDLVCELMDHLFDPEKIKLSPEIITRKRLEKGILVRIKPPDIKNLPLPEFDLLNKDNYLINRKPLRFCVSSRGCPYKCSFCSIHTVFGEKYRRRSNESIISEIRQNINDGIFQIDFEDDHFTANKTQTIELLERIARELPGLSLTLMNGLVYWTLNSELLEKMFKAGFRTLNLSLVSSEKNTHEASSRPEMEFKFSQIVNLAYKLGFSITAYLILGRPGQTINEMATSLRMLADLPVLIGASPYYLSPGSPDYILFKDSSDCLFQSQGKDQFFHARLVCMDIETKDFCRDDIYTFFRLSRFINYIKKGIDLGYSVQEDFFKEARNIIINKNWGSDNNSDLIPISTRVMIEVFSDGISVSGYKKNQKIYFPCIS